MFLSQIIFNLRNAKVLSELKNPYELHRTILKAFPIDLPESERVLYRVETRQQTAFSLPVIVQSQTQPNWCYLERNDLVVAPVQIKIFEPNYLVGQTLVFRLLANPTKRNKENGKRVGVHKKEELYQWIQRKVTVGGANLLFVTIESHGNVSGVKYQGEVQFNLHHLGVCFDGQIHISDPKKFANLLYKGVGSAKAFGFGLLSIALLH